MRVAVGELLFFPETDGKVVFNEAIEICRSYVDKDATGIFLTVIIAGFKYARTIFRFKGRPGRIGDIFRLIQELQGKLPGFPSGSHMLQK